MNSLTPDNAPAPHEAQSDGFPAPRLAAGEALEPPPEFRSQPEFEAQPLPGRPLRADSRTPFRWIDLLYLMLFYFICGGVLTLVVGSGHFILFRKFPAGFHSITAGLASDLIVNQALLF